MRKQITLDAQHIRAMEHQLQSKFQYIAHSVSVSSQGRPRRCRVAVESKAKGRGFQVVMAVARWIRDELGMDAELVGGLRRGQVIEVRS